MFVGAAFPAFIYKAISKNVLFPGHNYLPTTGTDDSTL